MAEHYAPGKSGAAATGEAGTTVEVRGPSRASMTGHGTDTGTESDGAATQEAVDLGLQRLEGRKTRWYSYVTTKDFWVALLVGQVLALCITGTNTFSSLLSQNKVSIPAFQSIFNYILLTLIYLSYTLYTYGFKKWARIMLKDGWKYFILSFLDVEGNYFTVLAYRDTNQLSAQLINFWAIVVVVIVSFFLLRVRYKLAQCLGILLCCGGMGILLASDYMRGINNYEAADALRGDLFALLGATLYGLTNTFEEWAVSKRPVYEVLSFLGFFGMFINGVQAAIFDRESFQNAEWRPEIAGYLVGYTLILCLFYSVVPLLLRIASAAFLNISLLTGNFWGTIIGVYVFQLSIHFLYPIAFVCIILGLVIYFLAGSMLGESKKPWLGEHQERGVAGVGTAKWKALREAKKLGADVETAPAAAPATERSTI
ncbi:hypothetical protein Micbo1qcDRAFT_158666 [Microdochium bolleyi]|uniref:Solute carrier family 35 member SLC35F1/F2/F6 n=1 Tax=Microdochium bolleyi TaxID=196109 RepID=A0A136J9E8_9PEZI|nr:hypothetical protein Micbo1qcDRAFT_158666 [Microdochium bolleyi]